MAVLCQGPSRSVHGEQVVEEYNLCIFCFFFLRGLFAIISATLCDH